MAWNSTELPKRPGLYINVVEAVQAQVQGGLKGVLAIPLVNYTGGTAVANEIYTVKNEEDALALFGSKANAESVLDALAAGTKEVLVYTLEAIDGVNVLEKDAYDKARAKFDAYPYDVFAYDGDVSQTEKELAVTWMKVNRDNGKPFFIVFGGDSADDQDPTIGDARSLLVKDDYAVNIVNGTKLNGVEKPSYKVAPYIAGLIVASPLNNSITYKEIEADDVNRRFTIVETRTALENGSLVLENDSEKVRVVQGLTTSGKKIRAMRVRQVIQADLTKTLSSNYIGKITNNADGQSYLMSMVKFFLEGLASENVLAQPTVKLDTNFPSDGDTVYLAISYVELDSMERILLTINV